MLEVGRIYNVDGTYMYLNRISTDGYGFSTTFEFELPTPPVPTDHITVGTTMASSYLDDNIAGTTIDSEYIPDDIDIYFKSKMEENNEDNKEEDNFDEWLKLLGES